MHQRSRHRDVNFDAQRSAFTLVEMLVAVALVLLMMSLFAEVFTLATGTMSRQKGLSENDQRARMVTTMLGSDFRKRSFRDVVPFMSGMNTSVFDADSSTSKRGYFAYSENNPADDTDDVLRLTIDTTQSQQDLGRDLSYNENPELDVARDNFLLYGRAASIGTGGVAQHPNQPEGDDGVFSANGAGQSTAAEVVWFLRGGNLYRRMMLIRKPYRSDLPMGSTYDATTGSPPTSTPILSAGYASFLNDFDYSAFYNDALGHVQFHVADSLSNITPFGTVNVGVLGNVPISLGIPPLRFGHSPKVAPFAPRETDQAGLFFGSFTHEETSNASFKYPGQPVTSGTDDPYTMPITLNSASNSVTEFSNGPRMGEDLLLSNVVSFDIKIWDPGVGNGPDGQPGFAGIDDDGDGTMDNATEMGAAYPWSNSAYKGAISDDGAWVDLGHSNNRGFYYRVSGNGNGFNTNYGNRFDTWHPIGGLGFPPYLAARYVPTGSQLATNFPDRETPAWAPNASHSPGDIVLPTDPIENGLRFAYRCLTIPTGVSSATEPTTWIQGAFAVTTESNGTTWEAIPNLIPVRALQIKIRYLDVSSGLLKDLTLVENLRDDL